MGKKLFLLYYLVAKGTRWVGYGGWLWNKNIQINSIYFLCFTSCRRCRRYSVHNIIQLIVSMSKMSKILKIYVFKFLYKCRRRRRYLKCMYTNYSCELNDSKSESDEVHTLELLLLMFITLSTMWCLWKGAVQSQLKFLLRGLGCSSHTCRRLWLTCKRAGVLGHRGASWSFLHKGWSSYWSKGCINGFKFQIIHV